MKENFAKKYRPRTLNEVVEQNQTINVLRSSLREGKVSPAYLLFGSFGTGKTTVARLLAKGLNCEQGITDSPCGVCSACVAIQDSSFFDLIEIDAASSRGIDSIRELKKLISCVPYARYRVVVVDECHQLTKEAFNALLKTLEEPPPRTVFVLVTTDISALPKTVVSRCQRFLFKEISIQGIKNRLKEIIQKENIALTDGLIDTIAHFSAGSLRDALFLLEQVSFLGESATETEISQLAGQPPLKKTLLLFDALLDNDASKIISSLTSLVEEGENLKRVLMNELRHFRDLLMIKVDRHGEFVQSKISIKYQKWLESRVNKVFSTQEILEYVSAINELLPKLEHGTDMSLVIQIALISVALKNINRRKK